VNLTDVRPEGGNQDPKEWAGMEEKQLLHRFPAQSLYPADFIRLIRLHRASRYISGCGIAYRESVQEDRARAGIGPHGTVYFCTAETLDSLFPIPCGNMPYSSIKTAVWDEEKGRFVNGILAKGWRSALRDLCKDRYLDPSDALTYLIGEDTFKLIEEKE
jgi:hypothetical protein